jgi:DNA repair exonuclease SbcCD ATPase subunit
VDFGKKIWKKIKKVPETVEKRETIEDMKKMVHSYVLEIKGKIDDVKSIIDGIEKRMNEVNSVYQELAKKIESYKKDIKELEESLFPSIQNEINVYRERIKRLEENFRKQEENYKSQLASIEEVISKYKEMGKRKGKYIKQITKLKERLGNLEREINRYYILEEKRDKIVGIIDKYLKTSSDYDENAQKMIEALDYEKEDLIAAYKLGRKLGYSREQLKNIAAAIALKESMRQRDEVIKSIGENPKEIRIYIAETAVNARKELKERLYKEIYK